MTRRKTAKVGPDGKPLGVAYEDFMPLSNKDKAQQAALVEELGADIKSVFPRIRKSLLQTYVYLEHMAAPGTSFPGRSGPRNKLSYMKEFVALAPQMLDEAERALKLEKQYEEHGHQGPADGDID